MPLLGDLLRRSQADPVLQNTYTSPPWMRHRMRLTRRGSVASCIVFQCSTITSLPFTIVTVPLSLHPVACSQQLIPCLSAPRSLSYLRVPQSSCQQKLSIGDTACSGWAASSQRRRAARYAHVSSQSSRGVRRETYERRHPEWYNQHRQVRTSVNELPFLSSPQLSKNVAIQRSAYASASRPSSLPARCLRRAL